MDINTNLRDEEPFTTELLSEEANGDKRVNSAITPLLLFSIFIAVSGSFAYGSAIGYSSPIESSMMEELSLTAAQYSLFGSMLTAGSLVGSFCSGKITDIVGRRGALGVSDGLSLLGWTAISVSQEAWSLYLGRFLVGASMGMFAYVVPVYIAEITPYNLRGGFVSIASLMISTGVLVMFFVGSLIPWRLLVLIGVVPSLMQLLGIFFIPESPRFLAKRGQNAAYIAVLQRLRGDSIDISNEAAEIEEFTESIRDIKEISFLGLCKRKYVHSLVAAFGLMALSGLGGPTSVLFYASSIFAAAGFSSSFVSVVLAVVQIPTAIVSAYLIDKCGRRPLLMGYSAAFPIGMAGIPYIVMSEVFSMDVKGSAGSLSTIGLSGSGWISSYAFNFVTKWSFSGAFFIYASINAFATLFVMNLVPETNGRTLEEIQDCLKKYALL